MSRYSGRSREYPGPDIQRMFRDEQGDLDWACNILFFDWRSDWEYRGMKWINSIMSQCDSQQRATRATYGRWNANQ